MPTITQRGQAVLVNTTTLNDQRNHQVVQLAGGNVVVVWEDYSRDLGGATGDTSGADIRAQVFNASGRKIGTEFLVNTATAYRQDNLSVVALPNGKYWTCHVFVPLRVLV